MISKAQILIYTIILAIILTNLTLAAQSDRERDRIQKQKEETEKKAKAQKYEDPNQPQVVRKTKRHPDADKLEVDLD